MRILIAGLLLATSVSAQAQSNILAMWEETPRGLVRVDNQEYVHQPQQTHQPRYDTEYHPGLMSPDFIHRPKHKMVDAYMLDCKCVRTIKVKLN